MKTLTIFKRGLFLFCILILASCGKEDFQQAERFDIDPFMGRYDFVVTKEEMKDGLLTSEQHIVTGYLQKENEIYFKLLFDFAEELVNCSYSYYVRADGSISSLNAGVGERYGNFLRNGVSLVEIFHLERDNYRKVEIEGNKNLDL